MVLGALCDVVALGSNVVSAQPQAQQQAQPTRSTGIGGVKEVKGGKEGQDAGEMSESGKKNLAGQ